MLTHSPMSALLKGTLVLQPNHFQDLLAVSWELLLETDNHLVAVAAASFLVSAVKQSDQAMELLTSEIKHVDPTRRICAVLR